MKGAMSPLVTLAGKPVFSNDSLTMADLYTISLYYRAVSINHDSSFMVLLPFYNGVEQIFYNSI
ncbi:MAG: hypothetical protein GY729_00850 [Desulfobacteraceae bacterium]|nr:hypothetical protein [Desulfobacteraceae bacterium]